MYPKSWQAKNKNKIKGEKNQQLDVQILIREGGGIYRIYQFWSLSFPVISTLTNKSGWSVQNSLFYVSFLKMLGRGQSVTEIYMLTRDILLIYVVIFISNFYMNKFHVNCFLSHVNILSKLHVGIDRWLYAIMFISRVTCICTCACRH